PSSTIHISTLTLNDALPILYHWFLPGKGGKKEMVVDRDTKIDEVAAELKNRIDRGEYAAGQRLPSEREIADELNVSRATVRGALDRKSTRLNSSHEWISYAV